MSRDIHQPLWQGVPGLRVERAWLQVITGSHDKTIRLWDIRAVRPKTMATLTYHKKSVSSAASP